MGGTGIACKGGEEGKGMYVYQATIVSQDELAPKLHLHVVARDMGEAVLKAATGEQFQAAIRRGVEPRVTQVVECGKVAQ